MTAHSAILTPSSLRGSHPHFTLLKRPGRAQFGHKEDRLASKLPSVCRATLKGWNLEPALSSGISINSEVQTHFNAYSAYSNLQG